MKELVEVMAKSLVSNPSAVVVEEETTGTTTVLLLQNGHLFVLLRMLRIWARLLANRAALPRQSALL